MKKLCTYALLAWSSTGIWAQNLPNINAVQDIRTGFLPEHTKYKSQESSATTNVNIGDVVINEFMASDSTTQADQDGQFDDWIEFYNNTNAPVNLNGYYFSDSYINPQKWQFPDTTIAANGYLIVWADNDTFQTGLHAYFKLNAGGERLILSAPNGSVLDSVSFGAQTTDVSVSRIPNGTGAFASSSPTYNASNSPTGIEKPEFEAKNWTFKLYPNPSNAGFVTLELNSAINTDFDYQIIDNLGRILVQKQLNNVAGNVMESLNTSNFAGGAYFIRIFGNKTSQTSMFIVR